ncbi:MAG TPA: aldehyde dehydrogenase family protein, partial [Epsilonproteobacteria bacterium]|nr:aldehyde dehydrogenase family protein [Campylobacterota bacterium]
MMEQFLAEAKEASRVFTTLTGKEKKRILEAMAEGLRANKTILIDANRIDMTHGEQNNLGSALMDRLSLDAKRVESMAVAIEEIAALKDPVGRVLDGWVTEDNLRIEKVSIPIGVIGIIYESRPNVTSDTAALCFKSSNVCILKGGKEAEHSNRAIAKILQDVLEANGLPRALIS